MKVFLAICMALCASLWVVKVAKHVDPLPDIEMLIAVGRVRRNDRICAISGWSASAILVRSLWHDSGFGCVVFCRFSA